MLELHLITRLFYSLSVTKKAFLISQKGFFYFNSFNILSVHRN
jgi:hypothetical protein